MSLDDRCQNWAACYRDRMRQGRALSFEGRSSSNRGNEVEWSTGVWLGTGTPIPIVPRDWRDADLINAAWQAIPDAFHQVVIGCWYVRRWAPNVCSAMARRVAGFPRRRSFVTDAEFERILTVAQILLAYQLTLPPVIRRTRLSLRVRTMLGLELWWTYLDSPSDVSYIPSHNSTSASA